MSPQEQSNPRSIIPLRLSGEKFSEDVRFQGLTERDVAETPLKITEQQRPKSKRSGRAPQPVNVQDIRELRSAVRGASLRAFAIGPQNAIVMGQDERERTGGGVRSD